MKQRIVATYVALYSSNAKDETGKYDNGNLKHFLNSHKEALQGGGGDIENVTKMLASASL